MLHQNQTPIRKWLPRGGLLVWLCVFIGLPAFSQFQVNGDAIQTACNCFTLTEDSQDKVGSVWNTHRLNLNEAFDLSFDIFLGCSNNGADGMAFGLQPIGTGVGSDGSGMGLGGFAPSLGVFLDTYRNTENNDPFNDHVSLQTNGNVTHNSGVNNLAGPVGVNNLEDCEWHILRIVWIPSRNNFVVYLDNDLHISYTGDIIGDVFGGDPMVYWGLTAATGARTNRHRFCTRVVPQFSFPKNVVCHGEEVPMQQNSYPELLIKETTWGFGDGTGTTEDSPVHVYENPGSYNIRLTITDINDCDFQVDYPIYVGLQVEANASLDNLCHGAELQLNSQVVLPSNFGCTVLLKLGDTGNNGWEGAKLRVFTNGNRIGDYYLVDGDANEFAIPITQGSSIGLAFIGGPANNECSFELQDVNGDPLFKVGPGLVDGATFYVPDVSCGFGPADLIYSWTPADSIQNPEQSFSMANPADTTLFSVRIDDLTSGCFGVDTIRVNVWEIGVQDSVILESCDTINDGQLFLKAEDGRAPYQYFFNETQNTTGQFSGIPIGAYAYRVVDADGCLKVGDIFMEKDPLCCYMVNQLGTRPPIAGFCDGEIAVEQELGAPPVRYSLDSGLTFQFDSVFSGLCPGRYHVLVQDNQGCPFFAQVDLLDSIPFDVYTPNSFTPNGDGINEDFRPIINDLGTSNYHFLIFNRWGDVVFETQDKLEGWNGEKQGKPCPIGVYVWKVLVKESATGRDHDFFGNLNLLR